MDKATKWIHHILPVVLCLCPLPLRYIEMPYYAGGCLADFKKKTGVHPSEEQLKVLFRQILMGLAYLHDNQVVHCDIKPENIFLVEAHDRGPFLLQAKIGDFDVSKDKSERTMWMKTRATTTRTSAGFSQMYMAPELLGERPEEASFASDVYAAGLIFYDLWLRPEPRRSSPTKKNAPPPLRGLGSPKVVSDEVVKLLQGWLHPNPRRRLTAKQLLAKPIFMAGEVQLKAKFEEEAKKARGGSRSCCYMTSELCDYGTSEELFLSDGLDCPAGNADHFVCRECLSLLVANQAKKSDLRERQGLPMCPCKPLKGSNGCASDKCYDLRLLAPLVSEEAYELQLQALQKVHEQKLMEESEASKKEAVERALDEYKRRAEIDVTALRCRKHVEERILNRLRCAREQCQKPFDPDHFDFSECLSFHCQGCNHDFCGWCLKVGKHFIEGEDDGSDR